MNNRIALAAAATLVLSGCGSADKPQAAASDAPKVAEAAPAASMPAPAASPAAGPAALPAKGDKPSKEFMIGKWGEAGDCVMAIDFKADGSTDGPFGNWALNDGVLTMADAPQKVHVVVVNAKTMELRLDGKGDPKMMTRCP